MPLPSPLTKEAFVEYKEQHRLTLLSIRAEINTVCNRHNQTCNLRAHVHCTHVVRVSELYQTYRAVLRRYENQLLVQRLNGSD